MMAGFIKLTKSEQMGRLLFDDPIAYRLMAVIAWRARRTDSALTGLKAGQAMIGDYKKLGMTEKQYRGAVKRLTKGGLIGAQGTNKGTVATILNTVCYDLNIDGEGRTKGDPEGGQRADKGRLTKKEDIKKKDNTIVESAITETIEYLNQKANKKFKVATASNRNHIRARMKEGATLQDLKYVIDIKTPQWINGNMDEYLRPTTLFNSEKFEGYLNESKRNGESQVGVVSYLDQLEENKRLREPSAEELAKRDAYYKELNKIK